MLAVVVGGGSGGGDDDDDDDVDDDDDDVVIATDSDRPVTPGEYVTLSNVDGWSTAASCGTGKLSSPKRL